MIYSGFATDGEVKRQLDALLEALKVGQRIEGDQSASSNTGVWVCVWFSLCLVTYIIVQFH